MPEHESDRSTHAARAAAHTVAVRGRDDLRVVYVRGDDRQSWLNGQVTNDLRALAPESGGSVHALAVNVRGKIMAELWIALSREQDGFLTLVPDSALATVLESFERYIIMEDIVLEPSSDARVFSVLGPRASELVAELNPSCTVFAGDELGTGGHFVVTTAGHAAETLALLTARCHEREGALLDEAGYELARLRRAVPRFGRDYDTTCYPQEAGLEHALSFQKGCYLGQEVVCTLENRGRLSRRLCMLASESNTALAAGTPLLDPSGEARGAVTSSVFDPDQNRTLALAYVKRAHANAGERLSANGEAFVVNRLVGSTG